MTWKRLIVVLPVVLVLAAVAVPAVAHKRELAWLRAATAEFHRVERAQRAGWDLVDGLDHCFDNPGVGGMGYHYINEGLLDTTVEVRRPEAMVYSPAPNGRLRLAAVEYIVPADAWAEAGEAGLPSALGQTFHLNEALGVYVLHAWIWQHNPAGMFEDWNPRVSCPVG